jgi:hypothetical protein
MQKTCTKCSILFQIDEADQAFYKKIDVPHPTLCPPCREQRRWAWRGKNFYLRECDKCKKKSMSWFAPELNITTYCEQCYRSDDFDATIYGQDFDFSLPFFEQFYKLLLQVPRHISNAMNNENCEYIISAHKNKSCYFTDETDYSRDCYFGYSLQQSKNIVEGLYVHQSEIGYSLIRAENCYSCFYSKNIFNCSNSAYLENCRDVRNSLFCSNLRNKEYHLFNKPVSKEIFQEAWNSVFDGTQEKQNIAKKKWEEFLQSQPTPANTMVNTENCNGDYLTNCKNVTDSYRVDNTQDARYCSDLHNSRNCYDVNIYEGELMYECAHVGPKGYMQLFSLLGWFSKNLYYCQEMHSSNDCFGSISLKKKQFHILNKPYSQEEYCQLKDRIIHHMKETKEYGEFFPMEMSPYPYEQTMAQRFYPREIEKKTGIQNKNIIQDLNICSYTGRPFRFTKEELKFYKQYGIPLPTLCPQERIEELWRQMLGKKQIRNCSKCLEKMDTNKSSELYPLVYCQNCYQSLVY